MKTYLRHSLTVRRICTSALALTALRLAAIEVPELNLAIDSKFKPVEMHGRTTAAFGWEMRDNPRLKASGLFGNYLSGEGLFDLKVEDGVMTLIFPEKLHNVYKKGDIEFDYTRSRTGFGNGKFRIRAKVKVERGRFAFSDGTVVKNSPEWQNIDYIGDRRISGFTYKPAPGGGFSITDLSVCPEFDRIGGEINLPDGGKLTKLLLPRNAGQMMRWCVALWQNWLWRLTGKALPVEVVDEVKPTPGALAVLTGETAPGGWRLTVDKNGIVVVCGEEATYVPAVLDYMRELGYSHYSHKIPVNVEPDPERVLKKIDKTVAPHYRYFVYGIDTIGNNERIVTYTRNTVDYFHLAKAKMDHILNVALPSEMYYKDHPEYFAMDNRGKRVVASYVYRTSPCFANKDAFEICANNVVKYALNQPKRPHLLFYIGDGGYSCRCDECAKVNRGVKGNYSQMMMLFYNRLAREMRKKSPGVRVAFGAYAEAQEPPVEIKPEPNVYCTYAVTHKRGFPCTLHQTCELNTFGWREVAAWSKYIGREKLGPMTYRDMRPLHAVERLKLMNKYMSYEIFSWIWMGFSPAIPFVVTRWNYGENDAVALLREFDAHYYGAAGKYVTEMNLMIEDFARNYKHTPEEIERAKNPGAELHVGIRVGVFTQHSALDRAMFDRIYDLLDRGAAALGTDAANRKFLENTWQEKAFYLFEDLNRYRLNSCKNEKDLAKYALRVAELVRIAREVPGVRKKLIPMHTTQEVFTSFTGIAIESKGKEWCFTPEVDAFMADPVKALAFTPERIPGGLRFPPRLMRGGIGTSNYRYMCPPRVANFVRRASSGQHEIAVNFKLDRAVKHDCMLAMEGMDDDRKGTGRFAVEVNGQRVFEGPNTFPENNWGRMAVTIPGGTLKAGMNVIKLVNTTPEEENTYNVTADYTWGWTGFSDLALLDPNGGFEALLEGGKRTGWNQARQKFNQPLGKVEVKDGKLHIKGGSAECTGTAFFLHHKFPKLATAPYKRIRICVTAAGKGKLSLGVWPYGAKGYMGRQRSTRTFDLTPEQRTIECTIKLPKGVQKVVPEIMVDGDGEAVVGSYRIEFLK